MHEPSPMGDLAGRVSPAACEGASRVAVRTRGGGRRGAHLYRLMRNKDARPCLGRMYAQFVRNGRTAGVPVSSSVAAAEFLPCQHGVYIVAPLPPFWRGSGWGSGFPDLLSIPN